MQAIKDFVKNPYHAVSALLFINGVLLIVLPIVRCFTR